MSNTLRIQFNPQASILTASHGSYGVIGSASTLTAITGSPVNGYDGVIAMNSSGLMVNGHNTAVLLKGANLTGINDAAFGDTNPWGSAYGQNDPNIPALAARKYNIQRFTVNAHSFWGLTTKGLTGSSGSPSWGSSYSCDIGGHYKDYLLRAFLQCRQFSQYIQVNLHECAPKFTFGGDTEFLGAIDQSPFMDYDTASLYWGGTDPATSMPAFIATNFGSAAFNTAHGYNGGVAGQFYNSNYGGASGINDFIFELYNEPYFGNTAGTFNLTSTAGTGLGNPAWIASHGSTLTTTDHGTAPVTPNEVAGAVNPGCEWVMLYGGYCSGISQQNVYQYGAGIPWGTLNSSWRVYGYQQARDAIRANGFTNVLLVAGDGFASKQSSIGYFMPNDTTGPNPMTTHQIGTHMHCYDSGSGFNSTLDPGSGTSSGMQYAIKTVNGTGTFAKAIPLIITESDPSTGSGPGSTQPASLYNFLTGTVDAQTTGKMHMEDFAGNYTLAVGSGSGNQYVGGGIYTSSRNITGSIAVGDHYAQPSVLTVTSTGGNTIKIGDAIKTTLSKNGWPVLLSQLTGTQGSTGTYVISDDQTCSSQTLNIQSIIETPGGDKTFADWSINHA